MKHVVIVGASLAGLRTAEALRHEGFDGHLTIIGSESEAPYDRPPLSKDILGGVAEPDGIRLTQRPDLEATWLLGDPAIELDPSKRCVRTAGRNVRFDGLVIATGSEPRRLAALKVGVEPARELRTLSDALALRAALQRHGHLTIVGAGFIGVEVASTARDLGVGVTMVSLLQPLAAAGELVSRHAATLLKEAGVAFHGGRTVTAVHGEGGSRVLELDNRTVVPASLVLSAVGVTPSTGWLSGSGFDVSDGVLCDEQCRVVGATRIVAVGDVARRRCPVLGARRVEHWSNAVESARVAARALLDKPEPPNARPIVPSFWSVHFKQRLQSIGLPGLGDRFELIEGSLAEGKFVAAAYRNETMVGAVTYGMTKGLIPFREAFACKARATHYDRGQAPEAAGSVPTGVNPPETAVGPTYGQAARRLANCSDDSESMMHQWEVLR